MGSLANLLIFSSSPATTSSLDLRRRSNILDSAHKVIPVSFPSFSSSTRRNFPSAIVFRSGLSTNKLNIEFVCALPDNAASPVPLISEEDADNVPMPIVLIGQDPETEATTVQLSFGDRLGALIDTMRALKDLGLNVTKGTAVTEGSETQTTFFITRIDTGRKVEDPDMLERIRLTVITNLLQYHPESSVQLAMGEAFGIKPPKEKLDVDIATHLHVKEDGPLRSLLYVETADRAGLILEIIKILADINIDVVSAKIDTEGLIAKDKFHVSYRGAALNPSLSQILLNCLRFYLRRPETDVDSY